MLVDMTGEESVVVHLREENDALRRQLVQAMENGVALRVQLDQALEQLASALARIAELEQQGRTGPPPFVKANRPAPTEPKPPRRKRAPEHNHGRCRETPTQIVQHALERCPECAYQLRGESIDYTRQVIEIPPPPPVEVIEHQVIKRYCPHCQKWRSPKLDLTGQVLGQGRLGVRLISLIAYLRSTLRVPVRLVLLYLASVHGVRLSAGEIVEVLHHMRRATAGTVTALKEEARASPVLHADETGWRENGRNGYIWGFSTPGENAIRYYTREVSRGHEVVVQMLGSTFSGHLVTDFYGAYNVYAGKHQRCWTHLLRDLHELKETYALQTPVVAWAKAVRTVYDAAQTWCATDQVRTREDREREYVRLVERVRKLGLVYAKKKKHPCQALAKRLLRHEDELFQFVLVPGLSANNNLAERSMRPLVVIRKISGGSRGKEGTKTRMALATLFGTWQARDLNPFEECVTLLSQSLSQQVEIPLP
jgi:transposase